jgi:2-iminobutanoate/2-iminopropanoate deaminase
VPSEHALEAPVTGIEFSSIGKTAARARVGSDVAQVGPWTLIAGQQPIDLDDERVPLPDGIEGQTRKILSNLDVILKAIGRTKDQVVSVRVYLVDFPRLYERMNSAYVGFFGGARLPARTCVGVSHLTRGALVEMEFVVYRADS